MLIAIINNRYKSINPLDMMVVMIASTLQWSRMIPMIPTIAEAGKHKITSSTPSALRGLPQPGRSTNITHIVATAIPSRIAEILPNRILTVSKKPVS
jgi:hypothetical protein